MHFRFKILDLFKFKFENLREQAELNYNHVNQRKDWKFGIIYTDANAIIYLKVISSKAQTFE